jgi:hypothetical protein
MPMSVCCEPSNYALIRISSVQVARQLADQHFLVARPVGRDIDWVSIGCLYSDVRISLYWPPAEQPGPAGAVTV